MTDDPARSNPALHWDERFAADDYLYGTQPNRFLAERLPELAPKPGLRLLLPGDGEGRNGVHVARQGHEAVVVDASTVARDKALALATTEGVSLDYTVADLTRWAPLADSVDGVIIVFLHLPPETRTFVFSKLLAALKPGGFVLLECFREEQLGRRSGGPPTRARLYNLEILQQEFADLDVELLEEASPILDEGRGHRGPAATIRLIGWKQP